MNGPLFHLIRMVIREAPDGGWGQAGHANANAELVAAARAELAALRSPSS